MALTNLETLSLSRCTGLGYDCCMALQQLPHLTLLDLYNCPQLSDATDEPHWRQVGFHERVMYSLGLVDPRDIFLHC